MTDPTPRKKVLGTFMPRMKMMDSNERESRTLSFVSVAFWIITIKYFIGGVDLVMFGLGVQPVSTMGEYAGSFAAILMVWLGREWIKKETEVK